MANLRDLAQMAEAAMLLEKMERTRDNPSARVELVGTLIQHGGHLLHKNAAAFPAEISQLLLEIVRWQAGEIARAHASGK